MSHITETAGAPHRGADPARAETSEPAPGDPLGVLIDHLRDHPRVDAAVFLVVDPDTEAIEPAAAWFSTPTLRVALEAAIDRRYDPGRPGLVEAALRHVGPLFLPVVEAWESAPALRERIEAQLGPADGREAWATLSQASVIGCPVRTYMGQAMGVLLVAAAEAESAFGIGDLDTVGVLADLGALAQNRSNMLAAEAGRTREELLLKRAAEGTAGSLEIRDVEIQAVEHSLRVVEADHAALTRVGERSSRLSTTASTGDQPARGETVIDPAVVAEVVRSQQTTVAASAPAAVHVPIQIGRRLFGVLSVVRIESDAFQSREVELIEAVARMSAAAMANALDFARERRLADALTRGFVPASPPAVPGFDTGFLYEPAERQVAGGDLFGAWQLPGGEVAVLVGDVAGKGVATAALSSMARFFIEARSWDSTDPAQTLAQAGTMLSGRLPGDTFVTAALGVLDRRGRLRYANAGHLRPLVLRAGGDLREAGGAGLPLGIYPSPEYENHELELGPGDLLLIFTDGLVEARRDGELLGYDRLGEIVRDAASRTEDVSELVRLIHQDALGWSGGLSDDVVLLAVRRTT